MNLVSTPFALEVGIGVPFTYRPRCAMMILKEVSGFFIYRTHPG